MKKEFNLKKSEIKKAEAFANKRTGKTDCRVTGYFVKNIDKDLGFKEIQLEICSNNMEDREDDVILQVCMWDRRRSFVVTW